VTQSAYTVDARPERGNPDERAARQAVILPFRSRALSRTVGIAGAGSGFPTYPPTLPNRHPASQSVRASTISSWLRAHEVPPHD
jgi:hypothetical protein